MVILPDGLHGAHLRAKLMADLGRSAFRRALADGRLTSYARGVVVDSRRATDFLTRAAGALLTAGPEAVLTRQTALALHGCTAAEQAPVHVRLPYQRQLRKRPGIVAHRGVVDPQDVEDIAGLRVLSMDAALAETLASSGRRAGIVCADQALRLLPVDARAEFFAWTEERVLRRADPRGRRQARFVLNLANGLAESPAESAMLLVIVEGGIPLPEQQYSIVDLAGREIYRLDFAWPAAMVALEYDGFEAHEGRESSDAARDVDLGRRGWIVVRAAAADLVEPSRVLASLGAAFRRRGFTD